jgi:tyrosine-protein phosphatase SIW14
MKSWFAPLVAVLPVILLSVAASSYATEDPIEDAALSLITNLHPVVPGQLYRGAHPGDAGLEALAKAGIRTIVDLQGGDSTADAGESAADRLEEKNFVEAHGMQFFNIPLSAMKVNFGSQEQSIKTALDLISDPANQPVFFHCFHGEDRTGVLAAIYRVTYQSCTIDEAHKEMIHDGHSPFLFWIDSYLKHSGNSFAAQPGRSSACPLKTDANFEI